MGEDATQLRIHIAGMSVAAAKSKDRLLKRTHVAIVQNTTGIYSTNCLSHRGEQAFS